MKRLTILLCLAALAIAGRAHAQQPTTLTFPNGARWDAAGQLALLNRNSESLAVEPLVFGAGC